MKIIVKRRHFNHPWIFSNEVINAKNIAPGSVVTVEEQRKIIGTGFYNPHSLIAVRLLSPVEEKIDRDFFHKKLRSAWVKRRDMGESYRLVASESDGLPGLVIDKYDKYFVIQVNCLGMEQFKKMIIELLIDEFKPEGIYEKSDEGLRKLEGLPATDNIIFGKIPALVEIEQDGYKYLVDIVNGQKTGFFFDQRQNRKMVRALAKGGILDCFCYTGGFSIYAGDRGEVLGIDSSEGAIELAKKNAEINNLKCTFKCAEVFKTLREFIKAGRKFDTIILDPPSFTKSKKEKKDALRGYKEINLSAMKILNPGGLLFTASCSYHISRQEFLQMLQSSAQDAHKQFQIIQEGMQSKDHPVLLNFPESNYLKSFLLCMLD
ncbi:MAG: class I SAM-dependent rRNA methyltransferase [bacterium]